MTTLTVMFAELFRGRLDAYGIDKGGCVRAIEPTYNNYLQIVRTHLDGSQVPIGVYPLVDGASPQHPPNVVRWGCSDLDHTGDDPTDALNLAAVLRFVDLNAWVEVSKSKGHHVWSFASEWVPAAVMRNAFLAAHQKLGLKATEVNPKQVTLEGKSFGNYVRLPYPGAISTGWAINDRQYMLHPKGGYSFPDFAEAAHGSRSPRAAYEAVAARYVDRSNPAMTPQWLQLARPTAVPDELLKVMSPYMRKIHRDGPPDHQDRSDRLVQLAHMAREELFGPNEAYAIVYDADWRWGKFSGRPDHELRLMEIIAKAYGSSDV